MARIYSVNQHHNCDYGVDFINGVAAVPDANAALIAWFTAQGYTVVTGSDTLSPWDLLPVEQLVLFAPYAGIDPEEMTKEELVEAIETALISLMNLEITAFDAIADVNGGTVALPTFANKDAIIAVLPTVVSATFEDGSRANVPVAAWVDTDTYNKAVAAKYTFTATLGAVPLPFANTATVTATVDVEVKA